MVTKNMVDLTNESHSLGDKFDKDRFNNRDVILVDMALSTGTNIYLSVKTAKKLGATRVFVATILASTSIYKEIKYEVDGVFCITKIEHFIDKEFYKQELK